jgi:hypothetical protein
VEETIGAPAFDQEFPESAPSAKAAAKRRERLGDFLGCDEAPDIGVTRLAQEFGQQAQAFVFVPAPQCRVQFCH